jgi:hypothetical protein
MVLAKAMRGLVEWRKTFSPRPKDPAAEVWYLAVRLDQMYCRSLLQEVPEIVERTLALQTIVLSNISDSPAFVYLREAANCYISGLPQAAVALSRAAVEHRLREVCRKTHGTKTVMEADFIEVIDRFSKGILDQEGRDLAHSVRLSGNDVLHNKPTDSPTALRVFEQARKVVQMLHGK